MIGYGRQRLALPSPPVGRRSAGNRQIAVEKCDVQNQADKLLAAFERCLAEG
jgi:hypothetical protein